MRTASGSASLRHIDYRVVPADAITLLSGVNFASVVKVIAAIEALSRFTGTPAQQLTVFDQVPLDGVRGDNDPLYADRAYYTRALCSELVRDVGMVHRYEDTLKLSGRFDAKADV